MFKFLLILFLIAYIFYYVGRTFFRVMYFFNGGPGVNRQERKRQKAGNVNVEYAPKKGKSFDIKDGEYVDYEEVK
jgi:anaerobic selenocysteine-containing dehydrogenase